MFGYIMINKAEMKFREFDVYHSYYCGICRDLKRKYGAAGQLFLSYDMTFLAMLLTGLYEPETRTGSCKCIAHPLERHVTRNNTFTEYAADMNALFACYKCKDDWKDEKKLHRLIHGRILEGKTGRLQEAYGEKLQKISRLMREFEKTEKTEDLRITKSRHRPEETGENPDTGPAEFWNAGQQKGEADSSLDTLAGLFGDVMAEIVAVREDEWAEELRRLGFFLGKFIYLMDAYEDVEEDSKKGTPNPLKERFGSPDFEEECRTILMMMISECCSAFEVLPILEHVEILRNVLYSGVWCRYEAIHEKRRKSNVCEADEWRLG